MTIKSNPSSYVEIYPNNHTGSKLKYKVFKKTNISDNPLTSTTNRESKTLNLNTASYYLSDNRKNNNNTQSQWQGQVHPEQPTQKRQQTQDLLTAEERLTLSPTIESSVPLYIGRNCESRKSNRSENQGKILKNSKQVQFKIPFDNVALKFEENLRTIL